MSIIGLIVVLLLIGVLFSGAVPANLNQLVYVLLVVLLVLLLLQAFGVLSGGPDLRLRP